MSKLMARAKHYVPKVSRFLVCVLYHEGKRRNLPITRLIDELLTSALKGTPGWETARNQLSERSALKDKDRQKVDS